MMDQVGMRYKKFVFKGANGDKIVYYVHINMVKRLQQPVQQNHELFQFSDFVIRPKDNNFLKMRYNLEVFIDSVIRHVN